MLKALAIKIVNAAIFGAFKKVYGNKEYLKYFYQTSVRLRGERLRISISALIRINIDGRFLLVRGNRIPHQFQPVGGVLKYHGTAASIFNKIGVSSDYDSFGYDDTIKDDLRIKIPAKNLVRFLKWYNTGKERENNPNREFQEELVQTDILSHAQFPHIRFEHVRQHLSPIHFSQHFSCYELLIAEIYELLPSDAQIEALRNTVATAGDTHVWATETAIRRRGHDVGSPGQSIVISETAEWLLNN